MLIAGTDDKTRENIASQRGWRSNSATRETGNHLGQPIRWKVEVIERYPGSTNAGCALSLAWSRLDAEVLKPPTH
jgi:hypothetical protein